MVHGRTTFLHSLLGCAAGIPVLAGTLRYTPPVNVGNCTYRPVRCETSGSPMSCDNLHTKRWSPTRVNLPVLPRESPSGKIQTRYLPPRREQLETNNSCSCSCSNSCSNLSHSWCMGEQLSYIHCWGVPQGSRSRPEAETGTLRYTRPVNVGNCTSPFLRQIG